MTNKSWSPLTLFTGKSSIELEKCCALCNAKSDVQLKALGRYLEHSARLAFNTTPNPFNTVPCVDTNVQLRTMEKSH